MRKCQGLLLGVLFYLISLGLGSSAQAQELTFGPRRLVTTITFAGTAQFANGFTLNRFAVSADAALTASIFGGETFNPQVELLPNLSVTFAENNGPYLPPVVLSGDEEVVELIGSVELDSQNHVHAFSSRVPFSGNEPPQMNAIAATEDGTVIGKPVPVAPGTEPGLAQLFSNSAIDAEDGLHVVFSTLSAEDADETGPIYYVRSNDGGANWSDPVPVDGVPNVPAFNNLIYPSVAVSPDGETVVVSYFDVRTEKIRTAKSVDGGATFPFNAEVFHFANPTFNIFSKVVMDSSGKIYVTFGADLDDDQSADVVLKTSADGITYGEPKMVNQTSTNFEGPIINMGIDAKGRIDVIWQSDPDGNDIPGTLNHARSTDGGATFSAPKTIATAPADDLVMNLGIRYDAANRVYIEYFFTGQELNDGGPIYIIIGTPPAEPVVPEDCGDGEDNDGDGSADCDDSDCNGDDQCDSGIGTVEGDGGGGCSLAPRSASRGFAVGFPLAGLIALVLLKRRSRNTLS